MRTFPALHMQRVNTEAEGHKESRPKIFRNEVIIQQDSYLRNNGIHEKSSIYVSFTYINLKI
jgi:hypothetical protein